MMAVSRQKPLRQVSLNSKNTICICGRFDVGLIVKTVIAAAWRMNREHVYIYIDSPGGYVAAVWPIQHALELVPNAIVVIKEADSAAAMLVARLPNKKIMVSDGRMLYHKIYVSGEPSEQVKAILKIENYLAMRDMAKLLNMNYVDYKRKVINGDWAFGADEALSRGIIQEIVDLNMDESFYN